MLLYEMVAPVDEDDFYSDVYRAWFEEIAWNWELEKEGFLPEEKDPFSEINMDRTLLAYRRLCACLTIVGKQKEIERVFNDGAYAEELFESIWYSGLTLSALNIIWTVRGRELMQGKECWKYDIIKILYIYNIKGEGIE